MSRITPRAPRLRHLTALATGVTTAITLTACGGPAANARSIPSASPTPKGVVDQKAASAILDTYQKVNNRANKTRNEKLLATVESGQVNEQSQADYKQWKTWSKKDQEFYGSDFVYVNRKYYIPAAGTASWFAVMARSSTDSKDDALLIFDKVDGAYKLVAGLYEDEMPIPKIATDRYGLATAASVSVKVGALAPNQLADSYEDLFETGGSKEGKYLASTKTAKDAIETYQERDNGTEAKWSTKRFFAAEPAHKTVYALKLADGGTLAVFPTAHTQETMLKPQYMSSFRVNPNKAESVYNSRSRVVITDEFQGQALASKFRDGPPTESVDRFRAVG